MSPAQQEPIIVFGPTGYVGSAVARALLESPTEPQVALAMRNPAKNIRGLPSAPTAVRVQADLTDANSVSKAVRESGAKRAFIYCMFQSRDGMRDVIVALKEAGVTFVVFLSSASIQVPLHEVSKEEEIPWLHAAVEKNLEEVFPGAHVNLRPGFFATNVLSWKDGIDKSEVRLFMPGIRFDYISHEDMGVVAAKFLLNWKEILREKVVVLHGAELVSQAEAIRVISRTLNRDITVTEIDFEEAVQQHVDEGMPEKTSRYLIEHLSNGSAEEGLKNTLDEGRSNVLKYTGNKASSFETWCERNSDLLS